MPSNCRFYIALTALAFKQFICSWIGLVNDFYILQTTFLDCGFVPSSSEVSLEKINKSYEEFQSDTSILAGSRIAEEKHNVINSSSLGLQSRAKTVTILD